MNRLLVINGSAPPMKCGVGYYGEKLIQQLPDELEVHLLTTDGLGETSIDSKFLHHTKNWRMTQLGKITSIIRGIKPGVIHIQYPAVGYKRELGINILSVWLRIFMPKTPVLVTLHEYYGSALLGKIRNIITVLAARKIIVSNQFDHDALPRFLKKKLIIIPIGHTLDVSSKNRNSYENFVRSVGLSPDKPTLAYFGFVNASKGIDTLVRASVNINAQILLLTQLDASNTYQNGILPLVEAAKDKGAVISVAGFLDNTLLSEILQECQLFVLPQPLPLTAKSSTAIVAAEHGLVVVSSASSKSAYNLPFVHDKNAILLDSMDEQSLAAACNEMLGNPDKMKHLRSNRQELVRYFDWKSIAQKHRELYAAISS